MRKLIQKNTSCIKVDFIFQKKQEEGLILSDNIILVWQSRGTTDLKAQLKKLNIYYQSILKQKIMIFARKEKKCREKISKCFTKKFLLVFITHTFFCAM